MENEIWKIVPHTGNIYEASTLGNIRCIKHSVSLKNGRNRMYPAKTLPSYAHRNGYLTVSIKIRGNSGKQLIHRIIALTFIGEEESTIQVCHINNIKTDNRLINLKYGTPKQNIHDSYVDGIRKMTWGHAFSKHPVAIYLQIFYMHNIGAKTAHISKMLELPNSTVNNIIINYNTFRSTIDKILLNEPIHNV